MKYELLVNSIEKTHSHFQQQASKAVNVALTLRNWLIGFYIVEFEQNGEDKSVYGEHLIDSLSLNLKHIKGIDRRSLFRFRQFYLLYGYLGKSISENILRNGFIPLPELIEKVGSVTPLLEEAAKVGSPTPLSENTNRIPADTIIYQLSYTHIEQLLNIEAELKRTFYEIESIKGCWSVKELKRQINSLYFERSGMSLKPELLRDITNQKAETLLPADIIKSVYAFEFLGLKTKDAVEESDLETALLDYLQDFMLEMGHGFCLEARQKKMLIGDEYFYVDLVFYHRVLKCHVLVDLKVEAFDHNNIGQLNTYVNYYKATVMLKEDNPPIGILLVTDKNKALVEFATAGIDNQLFVSKYLLELPGKEQLEAFIQKEIEKWKG